MKKLVFTLMLLTFGWSVVMSQNVGINADGSSPDGSAMLDVKSTSKGILIPRMTSAQKTAILSPVAGLMVYQTDATAGFYYWNGSAWTQIGVGGGSGTVTSVATGTGITGGPITTTGTISLATSGVTAGSYTRASITVDDYGRITVAGNGAAINLTTDVTGILPIANGGTGSATVNNWLLTGNVGTSAATNFIGTTDNVALNFKVNNQKAGRIEPTGATFIGYQAGNVNTVGSSTGFGYNALYSNTTGNNNTATGANALYSNTTGGYNTATGTNALNANTEGTFNTAIGYQTLTANTTGSTNTAIGASVLIRNTTGYHNTGIGSGSLVYNTTGKYNSVVGTTALADNTTGSNNIVSGTFAMQRNTTGNNNTALGYSALISNITGSNNTALGYSSDVSSDALTNATAIGYDALATASNQVVLGDANVTSFVVKGAYAGTSSAAPNMVVDVNGQIMRSTASLPTSSQWTTSGSNIYYNTGNVGVGTTTPTYLLHLKSSLPYLAFQDTDDPNGSIGTITQYQDGGVYMDANVNNTATTGSFKFRANGGVNTRMVIDNTGNVGIGTTSPQAKLQVDGSVFINNAAAPGFYGQSAGTNKVYLGYDGAGTGLELYNFTSAKSLMIRDNGYLTYPGNVGIGTTTPLTTLQLGPVGSIGQDINSIYFGTNFTTTGVNFLKTGNYASQMHFDGALNNIVFKSTSSTGTAGGSITWVERLRINGNNGFVGIGTATPTRLLSLKGSQSVISLFNSGTISWTGLEMFANNGTLLANIGLDDASGRFGINMKSDGTEDFTITQSGNVGIGNTSPGSKLHVYGTETGSNWAGRGVFGGASYAVVLGQYNDKAFLGAHNAALNAWADLAINPGGGNVGIGTSTPAATLDVNGVALSNFEGFSYYTTGTSITGGTWNSLTISTVDYNTFAGTPYNTTTGQFTAPRTGFYRFSIFGYSPTANTAALGDRYAMGVAVNGTLKGFAGGNYSASDSPLNAYSQVVHLNAGDVVRPSMFSAIAATIGAAGAGHYLYFQGEFVGK